MVAAAVIIVVLLRLVLGLFRYLDTDEFAYLHWSYLLTIGKLPYKDFFLNVTPFFSFILTPLFVLPYSSVILFIARCLSFTLWGGTGILLWKITRQLTRSTRASWLAFFVFSVFPMTIDKSIEIRPDTLMTALFLISLYLLIRKSPLSGTDALLSGFSLGTSVFLMPKIAIFVPLALFLLTRKNAIKQIIPFGVGLVTIPLAFLLFLFFFQIQHLAWNNIVLGSILIKEGEGAFSIRDSFSPWPLIYVTEGGVSLPWAVNVLFWIGAFLAIPVALLKRRLVGMVLFLSLVPGLGLLVVFPTPFMQYFIPLSVFVSLGIAVLYDLLPKRNTFIHYALLGSFLIVCLVSYYQQWIIRITQTNQEQRQVIDDILAISQPADTVYDMVGSYVFRPDGYYICCNIYSQFADRLGLPIPSLKDSLIANNTKYLILDRTGKSLWKPKQDDLEFLQKNFTPSAYPKIYIAQSVK